MMAVLRLIRLPNLALIALVQFLLRQFLILPAFTAEYFVTGTYPPHLSDLKFMLLVFSTLLIAAGGYIINDYYDIAIDEVNKPGKVMIGKTVSEKQALTVYGIITGAGLIIGFWLALTIGKPVMGFVNLFAAVSLWLYSSELKKKLIVGNLLIAVLTALALLITGLFEPEFYRNFLFLLIYTLYAFMLTLIREIIKDMEDIEGDERSQVKSLPVRIGITRTKWIVFMLIVITAWMLGNTLYRFFFTNTVFKFWNIFILCELPFVMLLYLLATSSEKKDFHFLSMITKIIMLLGILTLIPFYYYFLR